MTESTGKVSYNGRTCVKTNTLKKRIWKKGVSGRTEATETQSKQINHNRKKDKNKKRKKENRQNAL